MNNLDQLIGESIWNTYRSMAHVLIETESRGIRRSPRYSGAGKPDTKTMRGRGEGDANVPPESAIQGHEQKVSAHYADVLKNPGASREERKEAKLFVRKGPGWRQGPVRRY